ncbi:MAG: diguanylate cyclase [Lachnospiraceae bacterium]|nr:diguanylate cyclase [Lachnospiraceae bacterium]MDD5854545.1 diguanylate cyclase [Lachnospiraceae bacterium]
MAFGLIPLEKRLKDHIRNYSLDQIFDIGVLSDYLDSINKVTGLSLLLTDRHGEKAVSLGNFVGFKPDTVQAPGKKIRVEERTIAHLYVKEEELDTEAKKEIIDNLVTMLTKQAEKTYESAELSLYADELEKRLEKEQYQVTHGQKEDALTGVLNSTYFDNKLQVVDRSQVVPVAVVCANINDWKYVNDNFGDEESDRLIKVVADILKEEAKPEYIIGRCGGDFFNILIPMAEDDEAKEYCTRVQQRCLDFEDKHLAPSVACGSVLKYNVEQKLKDLLSDAEYEMFDNKFEIKNAPGYRERLEKA